MTNNPYIGPRTFSEAEAHLFFGREREARDLLSLVLAERLILFHAPSGAGKSSLMQTRLRPQLAKERFDVSLPVARVSGELPPDITAVSNIFTFNLILSLDQNRYPAYELTDLTLSDYLAKRVTPAANMPFLLIIDQFEEILTTNPQHWAQRQPFFEQLRQAMSDHEPLWVVLAMREDYVAALDPYSHLLPNRLRTRYAMQRLSYQAALQAVSKPATAAGRPFAPGVAEQLVDNLRQIKVQAFGENQTVLGEFVEPVQLQVVCYRLWERLAESKAESKVVRFESIPTALDISIALDSISMADLADLGDVDQTLADFYEEVLREVLRGSKQVSELQLREWFGKQLITPAETRGLVYQNNQTGETGGIPNNMVKQLQDRFILRAEVRAGGTWLELVHDRLVQPILRANQAWLEKIPLVQAALLWDEAGRPNEYLYRGKQLQESQQLSVELNLGSIVASFIQESKRYEKLRYIKNNLLANALMLVILLLLLISYFFFYYATQAREIAKTAVIKSTVAISVQQTAEAQADVAVIAQQTVEARVTEAISVQQTTEARVTVAVIAQQTAEAEVTVLNGLYFQNDAPENMWVAVGYVDDSGRWFSQGWFKLQHGETRRTLLGKLTQRYYAYYARNFNETYTISGDRQFWVRTDNKDWQNAYMGLTPNEATEQGFQARQFVVLDSGKPPRESIVVTIR